MKFTALNSGLLTAAISIVMMFVVYLMGPSAMSNGWMKFVLFLVSLALMIYLGLQGRKEVGGFWSYGQAFKYLIVMSLVSIPLVMVFNFVLLKVDPEFFQQVNQIAIDSQTEMFEKFGMDEDQINEAVTQAEANMEKMFTLEGQLWGLGIGLLFHVVLDLVLAIFIKKNKPEFAE